MTTPSTAPTVDTEARNRAIQDLRRALVQFGRAFDLLHGAECDCDDPNCANRNPDTMTAERLLDWLADAWHGLAGCGHSGEPEIPPTAAALRERNLRLAGHFARGLGRLSDAGWQSALERFRPLGSTPLFQEAEALVAHGVDSAIIGADEEEPWTPLALDAADAWADAWALPEDSADALRVAVECGVLGLLGCGLADRRLTDVLYEPFAAAIPVNELILRARLGEP
jgi:hypothetical protein